MSATTIETSASADVILPSIASIPPFKDLPEAVLSAVAEVATVRRCAENETLYAFGQYDGGELFVGAEGALKVSLADPDTGAMMIDIVKDGQIFGLAAAVAGATEQNCDKLTITSEEEALVLAIEVQAFRVIVAQRPSLTRNLMHHFAQTLAGERFTVAAEESSPQRRIYAALMEYVERDAVNADWRIAKMPKHRELAEKADVDETLVANAVAQLIQDEVARRDYPGLVISDISQLNKLAS